MQVLRTDRESTEQKGVSEWKWQILLRLYYGTIPPAPFQKARPPSSAQILRAASMTPV